MKGMRYQILNEYIQNRLENNQDLISEVNAMFESYDKVFQKHNLTEEEKDDFVGIVIDYSDFIVDVIANCPYLSINIDHLNDRVVRFD